MEKVVVHGRLFVRHPRLGWLMLGSWGWQPVAGPTVKEGER